MGNSCCSSKGVNQAYAPGAAKAEQPIFAESSGLAALLGPTLISSQGPVEVTKAIEGKTAVALYFSAHWCPPCQAFTPKLAQWYAKDLQAKGLEVVFVSSDRDESSFKEYFKEMPWLAIPFGDRGRKDALSKRFSVSGIPSLIILDSDGHVITEDGRSAVSNDPVGAKFPWKPRNLMEVMAGAKLLGQGGEEMSLSKATEGKTAFALYFSAHWCPPCRGFTPQLAKWYSENLKQKGLEVIFVSSDRDEDSFKEYFKEMPWLALDFSDRERKAELASIFGIRGIPSLIIVSPDGTTITKDGREVVGADPTGSKFPWSASH